MNPMNEAWALLKASPFYQAQLQGTNQEGAGGTLPPAFQRNPGRVEYRKNGNEYRHSAIGYDTAWRPRNIERQPHPTVSGERSFQSLQTMPGQEESEISRQPKQGFLQRRRNKKQQQLQQRAEETGEGKDYRAAYPIDDYYQRSVFDERGE